MLRELTERPLEDVAPCRRAREAEPGQLLEVRELREVHAFGRRLEARGRLDPGAERLDRVRELRVAAEELRAGVPHLERGRRPLQRSVQRRKAIVVDAG